MRSRLIVVALCLGLFFSVNNFAFAENLLDNPGFENGVADWGITGPNWQAQTEIVYSGDIALRNEIGTIPNQDYFASVYQTENLSAGETIYATLQTKTDIDPRSSAVAGLLIEFLNGSNQVIESTQDEVGGQTDWRQLYVSAIAPSGTVRVRFRAFVFATEEETTPPDGIALGGLVYFDEAVLSTEVIDPPSPQTDLVNAGYENGVHDWNLIYSPAFVVDDQDPYEGDYSIKNTIGTNPGNDFFASSYQDLQYLGGDIYGSAYIRTSLNPASSAVAGFLFEYYDQFDPAPGTRIGYDQQTVVGNHGWMRLLIDGVTPPAETVMVRVHTFTYAVEGDSSAIGSTANFDQIIFSYSPLEPEDFRTDLLNNGFENGLSGWSDLYGFPTEISTSIVHSGTQAAQKTIGVIEDQDYYAQVYQDIYLDEIGTPYPTGTDIYATAYGKTDMDPLTMSIAGLQLEFIDVQGEVILDDEDNPIVVNDVIGGQTGWRYLYVTAETPEGTVRVRVSGLVFAREEEAAVGGDAYFDDFEFSLSPLPRPPTQRQLLNRGFENGLHDWNQPFKSGAVSDEIVYRDNYSAVFEVDESVVFENFYGVVTQEIEVNSVTPYELRRDSIFPGVAHATVWVNTDISPLAEATNAGLLITFLDRNGDPIAEYTRSLTGLQDWTQLYIRRNVPEGTRKLRLTCFLFADQIDNVEAIGSKAYFDDVYLVVKKYPTYPTPTTSNRRP